MTAKTSTIGCIERAAGAACAIPGSDSFMSGRTIAHELETRSRVADRRLRLDFVLGKRAIAKFPKNNSTCLCSRDSIGKRLECTGKA